MFSIQSSGMMTFFGHHQICQVGMGLYIDCCLYKRFYGRQKLYIIMILLFMCSQVQAPWVKHFLSSDDDDLYILPG